MKKHTNELEALFAATQLEPSEKFVKNLRKQLFKKPKKRLAVLWSGAATATALAVLLIAVSFLRPPVPKQAANTILVKDLYAKALAYDPQTTGNITFWDITQKTEVGPQGRVCLNGIADMDQQVTKMLLFRSGAVSADYVLGGWPGALPTMGYSEDADVKAFNPDTISGAENSQIKSLLGAQLTDASGKPLPEDTKIPVKQSGTYDIYSKYTLSPESLKGYAPDCATYRTHVVIDAESGVFLAAEVYNGEIKPDKLSFALRQSVQVERNVQFKDVLPRLQAQGFDLAKAKEETNRLSYVPVDNIKAGYTFTYHKGTLGKAELEEMKDANGVTTAYRYHFAKQPQLVYIIYTAAGVKNATTYDSLKARASAQKWNESYDANFMQIEYDKQGTVSLRRFVADDGVKKYGVVETDSKDIPYIYVEAPVKAGIVKTVDPYITNPEVKVPDTDHILSLLGVLTFKPGTKPPIGL